MVIEPRSPCRALCTRRAAVTVGGNDRVETQRRR
jgi:hypothetical protein